MPEPSTAETAIKIVVLTLGVLGAAAYLVLVERRVAAWVQMRRGPNRVGIPLTRIRLFGLGQPIADGLKFIFKEEFVPAHVDWRLFTLAPIVIMVSALAIYAVIPFGSQLPPVPALGWNEPVALLAHPGLDVGVIYVFALSSIAVYGVILAGWSSNNKYSLIGALRSSAQLISYELPLGLGVLGVVLASGSLRLDAIIAGQADPEVGVWYAFSQPLGMVVFVVAVCAEAARLPFDLPEAEQELVGGYHTEYSGMRLMLLLTAEFIHMITAAFLIVILFLGGWHLWGVTGHAPAVTGWTEAILRVLVLMTKILIVILLFMLVRWTWPRFRYDQLMALAWKVMLPLGIVNLAAITVLGELEFGGTISRPELIAGGWTVAVVTGVVTALAAPQLADNRPQLDRRPTEP